MDMNGLLSGWRAVIGSVLGSRVVVSPVVVSSVVLSLVTGGTALASEEVSDASVERAVAGDDGYAMSDDADALDQDTLPLAQRYAPPPPRPRRYRPYAPYYHYRIVPPPIFAPG